MGVDIVILNWPRQPFRILPKNELKIIYFTRLLPMIKVYGAASADSEII